MEPAEVELLRSVIGEEVAPDAVEALRQFEAVPGFSRKLPDPEVQQGDGGVHPHRTPFVADPLHQRLPDRRRFGRPALVEGPPASPSFSAATRPDQRVGVAGGGDQRGGRGLARVGGGEIAPEVAGGVRPVQRAFRLVGGDGEQQVEGFPVQLPSPLVGLRAALDLPPARGVSPPLVHACRRPLRVLPRVALVAGVRDPETGGIRR